MTGGGAACDSKTPVCIDKGQLITAYAFADQDGRTMTDFWRIRSNWRAPAPTRAAVRPTGRRRRTVLVLRARLHCRARLFSNCFFFAIFLPIAHFEVGFLMLVNFVILFKFFSCSSYKQLELLTETLSDVVKFKYTRTCLQFTLSVSSLNGRVPFLSYYYYVFALDIVFFWFKCCCFLLLPNVK